MGPQIPAYDLKPKSSQVYWTSCQFQHQQVHPVLCGQKFGISISPRPGPLHDFPIISEGTRDISWTCSHGLTPHLHPRTSLQLENSLKKTPISFNFPNLVTTKVPFSASRFPGSHRNSRVAIWARGKFPAVVGSIFGSPSDRSWDPMLRQPHRQGLDLFCLAGWYMRGHWWFQGFLINLRNITFT